MDKEKTVIELEDDEAALVVNEDWTVKMSIPQLGDEDNVPDHLLYMTALSVLTTNDPEFIAYVMDKFFEEYMGEIE